MNFTESLLQVSQHDVAGLAEARKLYGDSWRAEGGLSAWFNVNNQPGQTTISEYDFERISVSTSGLYEHIIRFSYLDRYGLKFKLLSNS